MGNLIEMFEHAMTVIVVKPCTQGEAICLLTAKVAKEVTLLNRLRTSSDRKVVIRMIRIISPSGRAVCSKEGTRGYSSPVGGGLLAIIAIVLIPLMRGTLYSGEAICSGSVLGLNRRNITIWTK